MRTMVAVLDMAVWFGQERMDSEGREGSMARRALPAHARLPLPTPLPAPTPATTCHLPTSLPTSPATSPIHTLYLTLLPSTSYACSLHHLPYLPFPAYLLYRRTYTCTTPPTAPAFPHPAHTYPTTYTTTCLLPRLSATTFWRYWFRTLFLTVCTHAFGRTHAARRAWIGYLYLCAHMLKETNMREIL